MALEGMVVSYPTQKHNGIVKVGKVLGVGFNFKGEPTFVVEFNGRFEPWPCKLVVKGDVNEENNMEPKPSVENGKPVQGPKKEVAATEGKKASTKNGKKSGAAAKGKAVDAAADGVGGSFSVGGN